MTFVVVIAGMFACFSGLLKLFGKGRLPGGVQVLPVLEVLVGVAVPLYTLASRPSQAVLSWVLSGALALVLTSSLLQLSRARTHRRHREDTEAARLHVYVKYLSRTVGEEEPGPEKD